MINSLQINLAPAFEKLRESARAISESVPPEIRQAVDEVVEGKCQTLRLYDTFHTYLSLDQCVTRIMTRIIKFLNNFSSRQEETTEKSYSPVNRRESEARSSGDSRVFCHRHYSEEGDLRVSYFPRHFSLHWLEGALVGQRWQCLSSRPHRLQQRLECTGRERMVRSSQHRMVLTRFFWLGRTCILRAQPGVFRISSLMAILDAIFFFF